MGDDQANKTMIQGMLVVSINLSPPWMGDGQRILKMKPLTATLSANCNISHLVNLHTPPLTPLTFVTFTITKISN